MFVELDGARIFFDTIGSKFVPTDEGMQERPTMLVLHGGPGFDHTTLRPHFDRYADICQVVYIDHRGNGRSSGGKESWYLDRWADDIVDFCTALGIEKPIVFGQSFGGMVAMQYGARHPEHPASLILSSTMGRFQMDETLAMMERLGGARAVELTRAYFSKPTSELLNEYAEVCLPLYNQNSNPEGAAMMKHAKRKEDVPLHFFENELKHMDLLAGLSVIDCPVLVLGGAMDPITPTGCARELAAAIGPNARLEIFEHCGHGVHRDDPEGGDRAIREFLAAA